MGGARHRPDAALIETITLWRSIGLVELALIESCGTREFPPRLPGQPISYPVITED
jgi:hypothetical protein